jgi:GTPase SAR1 family protein
VVAGDQGVGKSTTINRLVKTQLFPMRSKAQADSDAPQTKVATRYTITKKAGANENVATVGTSCGDSNACKKSACQSQDVHKDRLATMVDEMQNQCFQGFFGVEDMITIDYFSPSAIDIAVIDLPGIQYSGAEMDKSKQLTKKWLTQFENTIILAVMGAEKQFQQEIFAILQDDVQKFKDRVLFVITKPAGIDEESERVLNMINDEKMKQFNAPGVILKSADTRKVAEADWTLDEQETDEIRWFQEHNLYYNRPEVWGIQKLRLLTQQKYLGVACRYIPRLQHDLQLDLTALETEIAEMPRTESVDALLQSITHAWRRFFELEVRGGETKPILKAIYSKYRKKQLPAEVYDPGKRQTLEVGGSKSLTCDHDFFSGWNQEAESMIIDVKTVMHKAAMKTASLAFTDSSKQQISMLPADPFIQKISSCDPDEAKKMLKRLVCSATKGFSETQEQHLKLLEREDQLPSMIVRMVVQMCVWEPLQNLHISIRDDALQEALSKSLNLNAIRQEKERIEGKLSAYRKLLGRPLVCDDPSMVKLPPPEIEV